MGRITQGPAEATVNWTEIQENLFSQAWGCEAQNLGLALEECTSVAERIDFLVQWFQSPMGQHIGQNPFARGKFAQVVGLDPRELGIWNAVCAQLERNTLKQLVQAFLDKTATFADLKRAVGK